MKSSTKWFGVAAILNAKVPANISTSSLGNKGNHSKDQIAYSSSYSFNYLPSVTWSCFGWGTHHVASTLNPVASTLPAQSIGGLTAKYALPRHWNAGMHAEYFGDSDRLFSGMAPAQENGSGIGSLFAPGFIVRAGHCRVRPNQHFFLSNAAGPLLHVQTTVTQRLMYGGRESKVVGKGDQSCSMSSL